MQMREERPQPNEPLKLGQHQVCAGQPRRLPAFPLSLWVPGDRHEAQGWICPLGTWRK